MNRKRKIRLLRLLVIAFLLFIVFSVPKVKVVQYAISPDGKTKAFVTDKYAWWIDGPSESLFLENRSSKSKIKLEKLGEDTMYCKDIVWEPNGKRVGFLIIGRYLRLFDTEKGSLIKNIDLVPQAKDYPPNPYVKAIRFSDDGLKLEYEICQKEKNDRERAEMNIN